MSHLFILTGNTSELSNDYLYPISLDPGSEWVVGFQSLQTFYSIPNIDENNNKIHIDNSVITIPPGNYEVEDIEEFVKQKLKISGLHEIRNYLRLHLKKKRETINYSENNINKFTNYSDKAGKDEKEKETEEEEDDEDEVNFFKLVPNLNTLKCELHSSHTIDFTQKGSIGPLLGFSKRLLRANFVHESDYAINIQKVNAILIDCNIATGSYKNGQLVHTLYEFFPNVDPGYRIIEQPSSLIYLPVNTQTINNITIRLVDQDGDLINFRGEKITVVLHLKKLS